MENFSKDKLIILNDLFLHQLQSGSGFLLGIDFEQHRKL